MTPEYPIFIPSKGRSSGPAKASTPDFLGASGLIYTLVVEAEEAGDYADAFPAARILSLPESDQGIRFARQWILDYARAADIGRYWQIDDDLTGFREIDEKDGRLLAVDAAYALARVERETDFGTKVALAGPDYAAFARMKLAALTWNTWAAGCVLTSTDTGIDYDERFTVREDIDFAVAHLVAGWETLLVSSIAQVQKPQGRDGAGGLNDWLEDDTREVYEALDSDLLETKYPGLTMRRRNSPRCTIRWAQLGSRRQGNRTWSPKASQKVDETQTGLAI